MWPLTASAWECFVEYKGFPSDGRKLEKVAAEQDVEATKWLVGGGGKYSTEAVVDQGESLDVNHGFFVDDEKPAVAEKGLQGLQRGGGQIHLLPLHREAQKTV